MKWLALLLFFFCFLTDTHASCDNIYGSSSCQGPYGGVMGGANFFKFKHVKAKFHPGYYVGGFLGYKCSNNMRLEGEISYQRAEVKSDKFYKNKNFSVDGHIRSWSYMANILYDFDLNFPIKPYVGFGVGYAQVKSHRSINSDLNGGPFSDFGVHRDINFRKNTVACQSILGIKYLICHGMEVGLDYRYFVYGKHDRSHKIGLSLTRYF